MTDLDIQIDVPDDDARSPVRVLNGGWLPGWFKPVAIALVAGLAALMIGAYLVGRSGSPGDVAPPGSSVPAPISSAEASPSVNAALEAVQAWEQFARSGDLSAVAGRFDPAGPQYRLFQERAAAGPPAATDAGGGATVDFAARNLAETVTTDLTTVSMDLVVTGPRGQELFPFDLVFRRGSDLVWTVVDRRSPGTAALPPTDETVAGVLAGWAAFVDAVAVDDAAAAAAVASSDSRRLIEQIAAAVSAPATGAVPPATPLDDTELLAQLADRVRSADRPGGVTLLSLFDAAQRRSIVTGQLTSWTQVSPDRIVATLVVDGQAVAIVPFTRDDSGWAFDLAEAVRSTASATG